MTTREWTSCRDDIRVRPVFPGGDVRRWTSCFKAFESYRVTAWECMHLVRRGHFRSDHVIKMAVTLFDPPYSKTPCYTQT